MINRFKNIIFVLFVSLLTQICFAHYNQISQATIGSKAKEILTILQTKKFESVSGENGTFINFALTTEVESKLGEEVKALVDIALTEIHRHLDYTNVHVGYNGKVIKIGTYALSDSVGLNPYYLIQLIEKNIDTLIIELNEGWNVSKTSIKEILKTSDYERLISHCTELIVMERPISWKGTDPEPLLKAIASAADFDNNHLQILNVEGETRFDASKTYVIGEKRIVNQILQSLKECELYAKIT